mmetsp:Transcript_14752/g.35137  ORF Transcript_14752/g.35137 Transcript_14752/m.35137 type:complete len:214 (+) Transcript_14752:1577-2218(+)
MVRDGAAPRLPPRGDRAAAPHPRRAHQRVPLAKGPRGRLWPGGQLAAAARGPPPAPRRREVRRPPGEVQGLPLPHDEGARRELPMAGDREVHLRRAHAQHEHLADPGAARRLEELRHGLRMDRQGQRAAAAAEAVLHTEGPPREDDGGLLQCTGDALPALDRGGGQPLPPEGVDATGVLRGEQGAALHGAVLLVRRRRFAVPGVHGGARGRGG